MRVIIVVLCYLFAVSHVLAIEGKHSFWEKKFSEKEALLVRNECSENIVAWQENKLFTPASLVKLLTGFYALKKWKQDKQFQTEFYLHGGTLWVRGLADPFLVSEEIEKIANRLKTVLPKVGQVALDDQYVSGEKVNGVGLSFDPYNAPISAIAANFNTIHLIRKNNRWDSAEEQTPYTDFAKKMAKALDKSVNNEQSIRVHVQNRENAQRQFAQILLNKLGWSHVRISTNQRLPQEAQRVYVHNNSRQLTDVVKAMMLYSNNFIANLLYLKLAEVKNKQTQRLSLISANAWIKQAVSNDFNWVDYHIEEGAGISRMNRLSATQIDDVLVALTPKRHLMQQYFQEQEEVNVFAKTGTLSGVQNIAGWLEYQNHVYRFVFLFNSNRSYSYRMKILQALVKQIKKQPQKYTCSLPHSG